MRVAVLGGGFAGIGCALELSKEHEVTLLEAQGGLGGVASGVDYNGATIPWGSHWILGTDKVLVDAVHEFGLEKRLRWKNVRMGFYYNGNIHGIANPIDLLRYRPLPPLDRIRFGLFGVRVALSGGSWAARLEGQSARSWLTKEASPAICDRLFEPLSRIKFNQSLEEISASWLYNRLVDTTKGGERYGFVDGGFETIIDSAGRRIRERGGEVRLGANVSRIVMNNGKVNAVEFVQDGKHKKVDVDAVVSTVPPPVLLKMADLPREFSDQLRKIRYKYIINAFFVLKRKLVKDFDWVNYCYDNLPFGGMLEHDLKTYTGGEEGSLLYVFTYLNEADELWGKTEEEIRKTYMESLARMFPELPSLVKHWRVFKSNLAWPVYDRNYGDYVPGYATPVKGLFMAGIYTTYPKMPSVGAAMESGFKAANLVKEYLRGAGR